ncbi:MAG: hemerythrin [Firmicutes bacterium HGW-Firmicutes-1]|jgi:hemerythrin|nr:MAG: hemerythrin [Firmicutes bacterium HGW-Firmicutes-1]
MANYIWSKDYSVGNTILDQHHQNLIKLFNDAFETIKADKPFSETNKIISELTTYSIFHFHEEEKLMKAAGYVDLEDHKKEHAEFIAKVKEFKQNISDDNSKLNEDIFLFLYDWLINHINITDKKYVSII